MKSEYGIIFDCDGTLVDSLGYALDSFNFALAQLGEAPRSAEEIKRYFGSAADRIFLNLLGDEKKALKAFDLYVDHQSELAKLMRLHPGIPELLDLLERNRIPLAIVTGRHARDLEIVLKPHGLASRFITLVADSHLPKSKPAPDGILLAAQRMGLDVRKTVYVGDSVTDIQAAHAANSRSIAATWDQLADEDALSRERPDFIARVAGDVWSDFKMFREGR